MAVFIFTAKINKRKIVTVLVGALIIGAVAWGAVLWSSSPASAAATANPKHVKTNEDRVAYLQAWGWNVSPEAVRVEELQMPEEFGSEYEQYLELQDSQGFRLTKYAGKRIKRYTYEILNYPNGVTGVTAHLLMYKNTVIGGEIMGGDFIHGLAMPEDSGTKSMSFLS